MPSVWVEIGDELCEAAEHMADVDDIVDALVTPCDDDTFAGVVEYSCALKGRVAELVCEGEVIGRAAHAIRMLTADQEDDETHGVAEPHVTQQRERLCEALWKLLYEAVHVVLHHHHDVSNMAVEVERCKLLGLLCHALVRKTPQGALCQRVAAATLHTLTQDATCLQMLCESAASFDDIWDYILPPLYGGDVCVAAEVQASLAELLSYDETAEAIHRTLYARHGSTLILGYRHAKDPTAVLQVCASLLHRHYWRFDRATYVAFFTGIYGECVASLREAACDDDDGSQGPHHQRAEERGSGLRRAVSHVMSAVSSPFRQPRHAAPRPEDVLCRLRAPLGGRTPVPMVIARVRRDRVRLLAVVQFMRRLAECNPDLFARRFVDDDVARLMIRCATSARGALVGACGAGLTAIRAALAQC
jgi:hypothetical protein